jgi:ABC-2 type transport system permease protein
MKRIRTLMSLDLSLSRRNSLAVYSVLAPLLLSVIIRLVIPAAGGGRFLFAVSSSLPHELKAALSRYGELEEFPSTDALTARVDRRDDVPGILFEGGTPLLLLQGNEDPGLGYVVSALLEDASRESLGIRFSVASLDRGADTADTIRTYASAMMLMLCLFIGGLTVGFAIVEEKESRMVRALAVSPLRMSEFLTARSFLAFLIGAAGGALSVVILMGGSISYVRLLIACLCSLLVALPFGFIIGAFADNQMTAFALVKLLMALFLTLPFVSIFVPSEWQRLFWIFPNYWMFRSFMDVLSGMSPGSCALSSALTAASGSIMTALLLPRLRRGLRFR